MEKILNSSSRNSIVLLNRLSLPDRFQKLEEEESNTHESNVATEKLSSESASEQENREKYATGTQLLSIAIAIYLSIFLVALDRTIITTAIPSIVNDFKSLIDIGWYASVYLLTAASFQLAYGRLYVLFSIKWTWWSAIFIFEIGSMVCAVAPSTFIFILGRAVAGLGSAGVIAGALTVIARTIPLHKRAAFTALFGAVFGLASVLGPLLGGAFTSNSSLTWRWCFYINLPIGGLVLILIALSASLASLHVNRNSTTFKEKLLLLDPIGTILFVGFNVCLFLALQTGGSLWSWNDWRIVLLFILSGLLGLGFVATQHILQDKATIPSRIAKNQSISSGMLYSFFSSGAMSVILYFLPLYFQVVQGLSATQSGILTIPTILSSVLANIAAGVIITAKLGYYAPFMIIGTCLLSCGSGLISTFKVDTDQAMWIGAQIIFGVGLGSGMLQPNLAAQNELSASDVPIGVSLMTFSTSIGGAIFVSVAQNVFDTDLLSTITAIPGVPHSTTNILYGGATSLRQSVPAEQLPQFLTSYDDALRKAFYTAAAVSAISVFGSVLMPWKRVTKR